MKKKLTDLKLFKQLIAEYPEYETEIVTLLTDNPDFQKMCEEFVEVAETLNFWIRLDKFPGNQIQKQITENRELLEELKQEILLALRQK